MTVPPEYVIITYGNISLNSEDAMEKFKRIAVWSIVIFVIAGVSFQTYRAATYKEPVLVYSEQKGPLDIKLIALRHDTEPDFYDVYGKKIEFTLPVETNPVTINSRYFYSMEFVFEIPKDKEIFFPSPLMNIIAGKNFSPGTSQGYRIVEQDSRKLLVVSSMFSNFVGRGSIFGGSRKRLSYVGLRLMYCYDRGKGLKPANATFKGPFQPGTVPIPLVGRTSNLLFNPDVTDDAGRVSASFDISGFNTGCIIVYDKDAKPHMIKKTDNKGNPWGGNLTCYIDDLKLQQIDSIDFRQNFDKQSFKNIKINPPKNEK